MAILKWYIFTRNKSVFYDSSNNISEYGLHTLFEVNIKQKKLIKIRDFLILLCSYKGKLNFIIIIILLFIIYFFKIVFETGYVALTGLELTI